MLSRMRPEDIGGGVVRRPFNTDGKYMRSGTQLTAEKILSWSWPNVQCMIDRGTLSVWPKSPGGAVVASGVAAGATDPPQRHIVHTGRGQYDVIEGTKLNDGPLKKPEAQALAGVPKDN